MINIKSQDDFMYNPLENKIRCFDVFKTYSGTTIAIYGFFDEDVTSAVLGLKKDVKDLIDTVYSEKEFTDDFPDDVQQAYLYCCGYFLGLIDKWFKDVI